jgi:hypothetical protein
MIKKNGYDQSKAKDVSVINQRGEKQEVKMLEEQHKA